MASKILLLTADISISGSVKRLIAAHTPCTVAVTCTNAIGEALEHLTADNFELILADLDHPDSDERQGLARLRSFAPDVPVALLRQRADDEQASRLRAEGACEIIPRAHVAGFSGSPPLERVFATIAKCEDTFLHRALSEVVINSPVEALVTVDKNGLVTRMNSTAERLTGWTCAEAMGRKVNEVVPLLNSVTRRPELHPLDVLVGLSDAVRFPVGYTLLRRDGVEIPVEDTVAPIRDGAGEMIGAVVLFREVARDAAMAGQIEHLAKHDFLTKLPNRLMLQDRLRQALILAARSGSAPALLFLDLDNFKHINDALGHSVGDDLLRAVATRLLSCVRKSDSVCRQGGDEFVILLPDNENREHAAHAAQKILGALALPHHMGEREFHISASIGISLGTCDGNDQETLLRNADTAMFRAKAHGKGGYCFFEQSMNDTAIERQIVEADLRRSLPLQQMVLHYQPKVDLRSGRVTGCEALVRWRHPDWGLVMPGRFIDIAEECGMIVPIGLWVLREACAQAMRWRHIGCDCGSVAANISPLQLRDKNFVAQVRDVLDASGWPAALLQLEITEGGSLRDTDATKEVLDALHELGVAIAIDDFGTGYSNLGYLHRFPIDVLKIDRSFVERIGGQDGSEQIVRAIVAIGSSLRHVVVAEGVETQAQVEFLRGIDCEQGQGYLFSRPLEVPAFAEFVAGRGGLGAMQGFVEPTN